MNILSTILRRVGKLEANVNALTPQAGPGIRLRKTPRGVTMQTTTQPAQHNNNSRSTVPTWG